MVQGLQRAMLSAYNSYKIATEDIEKNIEKISTGTRIPKFSDDSVDSASVVRMTNKISALEQANRNVKNSQDLLITADTGVAQVRSIVERLKEIGIESASDMITQEERTILSAEYDQLLEEVDFVISTTKYNGIELLDGTFLNKTVAIGINDDPDQQVQISLGDASADILGRTIQVAGTDTLFSVADSSVSDTSNSADSVETLDAALEQLIEYQSRIGASIRRFDFTITNLEGMILQTENNKNSLTALDEAREITNMTVNQIKQQTALAMMAQAQSLSHAIFQLLQNH
jgi:flagellin